MFKSGTRNDKELYFRFGDKEKLESYQECVENREQLRVCFRGGGWIAESSTDPPAIPFNAPPPNARRRRPLTVVPESDPSKRTPRSGVELNRTSFRSDLVAAPGQADTIRSGGFGDARV